MCESKGKKNLASRKLCLLLEPSSILEMERDCSHFPLDTTQQPTGAVCSQHGCLSRQSKGICSVKCICAAFWAKNISCTATTVPQHSCPAEYGAKPRAGLLVLRQEMAANLGRLGAPAASWEVGLGPRGLYCGHCGSC